MVGRGGIVRVVASAPPQDAVDDNPELPLADETPSCTLAAGAKTAAFLGGGGGAACGGATAWATACRAFRGPLLRGSLGRGRAREGTAHHEPLLGGRGPAQEGTAHHEANRASTAKAFLAGHFLGAQTPHLDTRQRIHAATAPKGLGVPRVALARSTRRRRPAGPAAGLADGGHAVAEFEQVRPAVETRAMRTDTSTTTGLVLGVIGWGAVGVVVVVAVVVVAVLGRWS